MFRAVGRLARLLQVFVYRIFLLACILLRIVGFVSVSRTSGLAIFFTVEVGVEEGRHPIALAVYVVRRTFSGGFFASFFALSRRDVRHVLAVRFFEVDLSGREYGKDRRIRLTCGSVEGLQLRCYQPAGRRESAYAAIGRAYFSSTGQAYCLVVTCRFRYVVLVSIVRR